MWLGIIYFRIIIGPTFPTRVPVYHRRDFVAASQFPRCRGPAFYYVESRHRVPAHLDEPLYPIVLTEPITVRVGHRVLCLSFFTPVFCLNYYSGTTGGRVRVLLD